jgi:hypothetical protein
MSGNFNQLEANLSPPDEEIPVYQCSWCDKDLFTGDEYFCIDGDHVCVDCIESCKCEVELPDEEYEE